MKTYSVVALSLFALVVSHSAVSDASAQVPCYQLPQQYTSYGASYAQAAPMTGAINPINQYSYYAAASAPANQPPYTPPYRGAPLYSYYTGDYGFTIPAIHQAQIPNIPFFGFWFR